MGTQVDKPKEKTKANNQQKLGKDPMQRGPKMKELPSAINWLVTKVL
jgi:hypothetical protein